MEDDVTFCVHVKNRRAQLERTLPANLERIRSQAHDARVGLVVLDYNSGDGLHAWIAETFMGDVKSGRLLYARERTARHFHASKAKNLAHRVAGGRLLVNLDADNFIDDTIPYLVEKSSSRDVADVVLHMWSGTFGDGTFGRIAIAKTLFSTLGGYDESLLPIGSEDRDLLRRARRYGARVVATGAEARARALPNPRSESVRHTGSRLGWRTMNRLNRLRSIVSTAMRGPIANRGGWGKARLEINFEREIELR